MKHSKLREYVIHAKSDDLTAIQDAVAHYRRDGGTATIVQMQDVLDMADGVDDALSFIRSTLDIPTKIELDNFVQLYIHL